MKTFYITFLLLLFSRHCTAHNTDYTVQVDHINKSLQVKSCFQHAPKYLYSTSNSAWKLIENIKWQDKPTEQYYGKIYLSEGEKGCISYSINTSLVNKRLNNTRINQQHPHDSILKISDWLWKSSDFDRASQSKITFLHKAGINVSTPWSLINRTTDKTEYSMMYTPDSWVGHIGFGEFEIIDLNISNSQIHLAIINGNNVFNKSSIIDWITQMTNAVANIGNGFPLNELQVMVLLLKGNNGAVPWGQVNRSGGSGVFFVVNPNSSHKELIADWTAAHEFSHLLLPYTPDDRWLSEGFASYHQNISRARTGLLNEKSTWEKLLAGFERGQKAADKHNAPALKYAKGRNRMQMYWGGAVIALKADVALQQKTNGHFTLSRALDKLNDCCLDTAQEWTARETFARLDKITNTRIFSQLYNQEVKYKSYPRYQQLLKELGIKQNYYGRIYLDDTAEKAHIRKRIING